MNTNTDKILDFSDNINPLGLTQKIKDELIKSIDLCTNYPNKLYDEVIDTISHYEKVDKKKIIIGNGSTDLIFRIVNLVRPTKALLIAPTASDYENALDSVGCAISYHRLLEQNQFVLDETVLFKLTPNVDICFLCNPNNPTGQRVPKQLLLRIAKQCKENGILLVIDEGFIDFVEQSELYTLKDVIDTYENIIIIKALSKTYALSGLRFGYLLCSNADMINKLNKSAQKYSVCTPACIAVKTALSDNEYIEKSKKLFREEYEFLKSELENLNFLVFPSKANFILFKTSQINLVDKLKQNNILIRRCDDFKGLSNNYFRISIRDRKSNEILINNLTQIVKK